MLFTDYRNIENKVVKILYKIAESVCKTRRNSIATVLMLASNLFVAYIVIIFLLFI